VFALSLLCATTADAAAPPARPPHALTAKQARDGWLELFDGSSTSGWVVQGEAKVEGVVLRVGGKEAAKVATAAHFQYGVVRFECRWSGRHRPRKSYPGSGGASLLGEGGLSRFEAYEFTSAPPREAKGDRERREPLPGPLLFEVPAGSVLELRLAHYKPLMTRSLFNGKDLKGWKQVWDDDEKDRAKFAVTKEGWLNVKGGHGELQSDLTLDDFVLQLECRTNGKDHSGGVGLRGLHGDHESGYRVQISNALKGGKGDDRFAYYAITFFEPKTQTWRVQAHRTIFSNYGTGAIYFRMPARSQAAKDREWFTLTVVARGRHFATWVNGVRQVDWTDHRPEWKNATSGYFASGCVSLLGDAGGDLSFRNVRYSRLNRLKK
jgi:hypothetical protein